MDYEVYLIKEFIHWKLYLHIDQYPFLGRCYAWATRPEADVITDMLASEREDLFHSVIPEWDRVIKKLYNHNRPNLSILGNESPHLHAHFITRYWNPVTFYDIEFVDPNPKGDYAPYEEREIEENILFEIRDTIKEELISV